MISNHKRLLATLKGEKTDRPSFWFMRQAGRYLPEYRELRGKCPNFLEFCYTPEIACEATLQPIRRFGMDAAIIFSDILVVPDALGVDVRFEEGIGPVLVPIHTQKSLDALSAEHLQKKLAPVYEALRRTRAALPAETTLIGFAGAPWTLACYVVQGRGDKEFKSARAIAAENRRFFSQMIDLLTTAVAQHAIAQIRAGAEVIQLFDSWAGILHEEEFSDWVLGPTRRIVAAIRKECPDVPVIGFPRQSGVKCMAYAEKTGVDAVSFDGSVSLSWVKEKLQKRCIVQGNLDQQLLADDQSAMLVQARNIIETLANKSFVFNLAHGILPHTPTQHVEALCNYLKSV